MTDFIDSSLNTAAFLLCRGFTLKELQYVHKSRPARFLFVFADPDNDIQLIKQDFFSDNPGVNLSVFLNYRKELLTRIAEEKLKFEKP